MGKTFQELQSEIRALEKEAALARKFEVSEAIANVKRLIKTFGLTAEECGFGVVRSKVETKKSPRRKPKASGQGSNLGGHGLRTKGRKVPIKYSDGANTWTGRGKRPVWVSRSLESGVTLESLLVSQNDKKAD